MLRVELGVKPHARKLVKRNVFYVECVNKDNYVTVTKRAMDEVGAEYHRYLTGNVIISDMEVLTC